MKEIEEKVEKSDKESSIVSVRELPFIKVKEDEQKIRSSLRFVTLVRCAYAVLVLVYSIIWVFGGSRHSLDTYNDLLSVAVIEIFVFTVVSSVALLRNRFIRTVTYLGMFNDALLSAFIVVFTGYSTSPFIYLFLLIPMYGGIILKKKGGIVGAIIVTFVLWGVYLYFGYFWISYIPKELSLTLEPMIMQNVNIWRSIVPITGASLGVGLMSGQLASMYASVEKRLIESRDEFMHLRGIYSRMMESIHVGVVVVNTISGDVLYTNPYVREMFNDMQDKDLLNLLTGEEKIISKDNRYFQIDSFPFTLQQGDGLVGYHITDITAQKLAEEERTHRQRLELLGEFSSKVAHEIRNPLACISGCNEMLQVDEQDPEQKQIYEMMSHEIGRLDHLIGDILVFARTPKLQKRQLQLKSLLESQKNLFLKAVEYQNMKLELEIPESAELNADEASLIQIVMTLWKNSADATENQGTITVIAEENPLRIYCSDDGPGIPEDMESRVFEPFVTTKSNGTGLGLAIARQLAYDNDLELKWDSTLKCFELSHQVSGS